MNDHEQKRFDQLYQRHVCALKLHGYAASTIDVYARAVRRLASYYDCVPDQLSVEQLEVYFTALVDSHSWATVRVDRNGLQFFWRQVLKMDWDWVEIIKPPQVRTLPDILTPGEVEHLIAAARHMSRGGTQKAFGVLLDECGIKKDLHSLPAPQLCHPSARTRFKPAPYPGSVGSRQPHHHCTLCTPDPDYRTERGERHQSTRQ